MNKKYKFCWSLLVAVSAVNCSLAAIMSAESRIDKLDKYKGVLDREVRPIDESLLVIALDPFVPNRGKVAAVVVEEEVVLSDEELLASLSAYVNPTGIFMFGGEFYLIFKEKKLKVGSELGINFNGTEYRITIAEITGSTYRISRGEAELQLKLK